MSEKTAADKTAAEPADYVNSRARRYVPTIKDQVDVTPDNYGYLELVAKRAAFERIGFSPFMYDTDTPGACYVNALNTSHAPENQSAYTIKFDENGKAVECRCGADKYNETCKHRVRAQELIGDAAADFINDNERDGNGGNDNDNDGDNDNGGVVLNRYQGRDSTDGTIADGLANLKRIKGE